MVAIGIAVTTVIVTVMVPALLNERVTLLALPVAVALPSLKTNV